MTEYVHPPFSGTLRFFRAWAKKHGGTVTIVHRNPRGVISVVQGGARHVYHFDKYGNRDGKYSKGSQMPVDWLAQMSAAYTEANPDSWKDYAVELPQDNYRSGWDRIWGKKE